MTEASRTPAAGRAVVGVSLKTYFGNARARDWFRLIASEVREQPAVAEGRIEVFVAPTYLQVGDALAAFSGTGVHVGAQDVSAHESGAYTGEVAAAELAEVGVTHVEIGHAERRALFGETDDDVAAKTRAALRHGLVPVLCVGEREQQDPARAADEAVAQLGAALDGAPAGRVIVAYEPVWAIGAPAPAPDGHIAAVARTLRSELDARLDRRGSAVIYGGSASPGQLTRLGDAVDGLFLGRSAHEPDGFRRVLQEAQTAAPSGHSG